MGRSAPWHPYCGEAPDPAAWLGRWNLDPWLILPIAPAFPTSYLFGIHSEVWIAPPPLWTLAAIVGLYSLAATFALLANRVLAKRSESGRMTWVLMGGAALALVAANWFDATSWGNAGLVASASGQGATVYAMIAQQASVVAIALLMAGYLTVRGGRGLITAPNNATFDLTRRFILFAAAQGVFVAALPRLVPLGG